MKKFNSKNYLTHCISTQWQGEYVVVLCDKRDKHALAIRFQNIEDFRITGRYICFSRPQTISSLRVSILSDGLERWQNLLSGEWIEVV